LPHATFDTYQGSLPFVRFQTAEGYSRLIQCAEHLPDPQDILQATYSNSTWKNGLLNKIEDMASHRYVDDRFVHQLDARFSGYPDSRETFYSDGLGLDPKSETGS